MDLSSPDPLLSLLLTPCTTSTSVLITSFSPDVGLVRQFSAAAARSDLLGRSAEMPEMSWNALMVTRRERCEARLARIRDRRALPATNAAAVSLTPRGTAASMHGASRRRRLAR